jgi:hypothetical protein
MLRLIIYSKGKGSTLMVQDTLDPQGFLLQGKLYNSV